MPKTIITRDGNLIYNDIPFALEQMEKKLNDPAYAGCTCVYQMQTDKDREYFLFRQACGNQACIDEILQL